MENKEWKEKQVEFYLKIIGMQGQRLGQTLEPREIRENSYALIHIIVRAKREILRGLE